MNYFEEKLSKMVKDEVESFMMSCIRHGVMPEDIAMAFRQRFGDDCVNVYTEFSSMITHILINVFNRRYSIAIPVIRGLSGGYVPPERVEVEIVTLPKELFEI